MCLIIRRRHSRKPQNIACSLPTHVESRSWPPGRGRPFLRPLSLSPLSPLLLSFSSQLSVVRPLPLPIFSVRPLSLPSRERSCQGATLRRARKRATCTLVQHRRRPIACPLPLTLPECIAALSLSLDSRFRSLLIDISKIHRLKYLIAGASSRGLFGRAAAGQSVSNLLSTRARITSLSLVSIYPRSPGPPVYNLCITNHAGVNAILRIEHLSRNTREGGWKDRLRRG